MPIKKKEKKKPITRKRIKFNIKSVLFIVGILLLISISYLFFRGNNETQKDLLNKKLAKQQVDVKKSEGNYILPVEKARLELISSENSDTIRVVIEKRYPDIEYRFQWQINGKVVENYNKDSISGFKEGDRIGVTITPVFEEKEGQPKFLSLTIHTTVPRVLGMSEPKIDNDVMVFKVLTDDATKEGLIYTLVDAPKGMTIDRRTGEIRWNIKDVPPGKYEGKALIKNRKGAEVLYPLIINLN